MPGENLQCAAWITPWAPNPYPSATELVWLISVVRSQTKTAFLPLASAS